MTISKKMLATNLHIGGQIQIDDLNDLKANNFQTVICLRPDNEEALQPLASALAVKASSLGLVFHQLPCVLDQISESEAIEFKRLQDEAKGAVFAFCKSGMRAVALWALAESNGSGWDVVIDRAQSHGFNIRMLQERLSK